MTEGQPLVVADNLVKEYVLSGISGGYRVRALDRVSLAIRAGESFGVVGESGSGKSTLARVLLGLERPTSGTVTFQEQDLNALSPARLRDLRRNIQIVFQDPTGSLNRRKTAEQIISAPLDVHGIGSRSERRSRVRELLELVGLNADHHARRYPSQLSGGQAQRVGIARALALDPKFVIFDEPVSALDVSVRAQILNLIRDLQERLNLTYLFISHDLGIVRYMSRRVAVMYRGRVVETGSREELYTDPRHPYTYELVTSIPMPDPSARRAPVPLLRVHATDTEEESGCRFRPRCPIGRLEAICQTVDPQLYEVVGERRAACHFAESSPELLRTAPARTSTRSPG